MQLRRQKLYQWFTATQSKRTRRYLSRYCRSGSDVIRIEIGGTETISGGDEMLAFFFLFNRKAKRATQSNRSAIIDSCASQIVSSAGLRWYVFSRDGILPARVCLLMFYCAMVWKTPILPVVLKRGGRAAISRQKAFFFLLFPSLLFYVKTLMIQSTTPLTSKTNNCRSTFVEETARKFHDYFRPAASSLLFFTSSIDTAVEI